MSPNYLVIIFGWILIITTPKSSEDNESNKTLSPRFTPSSINLPENNALGVIYDMDKFWVRLKRLSLILLEIPFGAVESHHESCVLKSLI